MKKSENLKSLYERKYLDISPQAMNSLVAPQTSGAKILRVFNFKKEGDEYSEFQDKNVTDIGGGLSSLAFELSPSAKKVTVVDPMFAYDRKLLIERESVRAEKRTRIFDTLDQNVSEDIKEVRKSNKKDTEEVEYGMKKWKEFDPQNSGNIEINDSFAQDIKGIADDSQDAVFFSFVLDKLEGDEGQEKEIALALDNAYRISKNGAKIYGIHDKVHSEDSIINALEKGAYRWDGHHQGRYFCFTIDVNK